MLRGIQAFQARWLALVSHHPTTRDDNTVIAHAMGQLIDQYETPVQIEQTLPDHLKGLFRELAMAYFQGYTPEAEAETASGIVEPAPLLEEPSHPAVCHISGAVEKVRSLAQNARRDPRWGRGRAPADLSEADTLIIEFPDGWPYSD